MSTQTKSNVEDLIRRLEVKQSLLIAALRGHDVSEYDALTYAIKAPSVWVNCRDLRLAVDELVALLKEVRTQAK